MNPLPSPTALETYYLEARSKILDLAAFLDRLNRGKEIGSVGQDSRLQKIAQALEILQDQSGGRAERIQQVFSLPYELNWEKPTPRY